MPKKDKNEDRLFFHDVINHIHGILLFLNHKTEDKKDLAFFECEKLVRELQLLQSLIQDHFGFYHKNLSSSHHYEDTAFIKKEVMDIIQNFLPDKSCKIVFKGNFPGKIHYPAFYRIMGNIVKNIAESQGNAMEFLFAFQKKGLYLTVKNEIDLEKEKKNFESVGLLSITSLCEKMGGEFDSFKERNNWINKAFLPWYEEKRD